ncbi:MULTISPECIES: hypothetical protein [unclassified Brenneria]|nr:MULTISPECIES: hypothetical protein [unclassified Brenneria]MDX5627308.1 hypothetical protein [Brenneria sp. L3-3Z]MDX5694536.1 hypothetical protein [Brenneria sp. L4-2C]
MCYRVQYRVVQVEQSVDIPSSMPELPTAPTCGRPGVPIIK